MNVQRLFAFSDGDAGGNPAGVYISNTHPSESEMQTIAAEVGYSETVFAMPGKNGWRVRYFSPETEVPFCGHATIALGAALARQEGPAVFALELNEASITVEGFQDGDVLSAALQSPNTHSQAADPDEVSAALSMFGLSANDLDNTIPPARANAGAEHLIISLNSRSALSLMKYELDTGREFMRASNLVTIMLVHAVSEQLFHSRNPFASGGVYEDPATGAASAAFAGYLRDIQWPHGGEIDIVQGEDMGARSLIKARFSDDPGSSIRVSGAARIIDAR